MVAGASFMLLGPKQTMVESSKPVIAYALAEPGLERARLPAALLKYFVIWVKRSLW